MTAKNFIDPETQLTPRQRNLLFAIIKEYCDTGLSVGSKELRDKYRFDFSPATIRNELVRLRDLGYLYQPFTNASSQPTEKAFKIFINQLILGLQVTSKQQQDLKKKILEMEEKQANLHKEISRLLAFQTGGVGFSLDKQRENIAGISNLLSTPSEGKVSDILDFLDNLDTYKPFLLENKSQEHIKNQLATTDEHILRTVYGSDNPILPLGQGYALVATEVYIDEEKTVVGLITPVHLLAKKQNLELVQSLASVLSKNKGKKDTK